MVQRYATGFTNRTYVYVFFVITFVVFLMLYLQTPDKPNQISILENVEYTLSVGLKHLLLNASESTFHYNSSQHKFLVHTSKCKIPNLSPFNSEMMPYYNPKKYIKCSDKPLLTYITKKNNVATLHLDKRYEDEYGKGIHCCFSYISRGETDLNLNQDYCVEFHDKVELTNNTVLVLCLDENTDPVYKNVHTTVTVTEKVAKKLQKHKSKKQHLSVLFVGIDSISRMNLFRSLPKTHIFLKDNDWYEFEGYNKINDNTFPNLMAILTGLNETTAFRICNPRVLGMLDKCNIIWYDYRKLGFITGYAEDEADINTFNYLKKGFKFAPADYYFRPYIYGSERYLEWKAVDVVRYCTGPENAGERIFNIARDFTSTFKNYSNFGLFWMNSYSHNDINSVSRMDEKIADFLSDITKNKILDNSIVIFLSDHGFRFGEITYTHTGWLEDRLPFFYMHLPKWFKRRYPQKHLNLIKNTKKLTTPYDLHMTLQEILVLAGKNHTITQSSGCANCKSLFSKIETERSCEDAGIPIHWCTCGGYLLIPSTNLLAEEGAKFIISEIRKSILNSGGDFDMCVNLELSQVISAGISDTINVTRLDNAYLLITFKTYPKAVFQGTLSINLNTSVPMFKMEGSISRLDLYKENSECVNDATLKKYCYCEERFNYFFKTLKKRVYNLFS